MPEVELTDEEQALVDKIRETGLPPEELLGRAEGKGGSSLSKEELNKVLDEREKKRRQDEAIAASRQQVVKTIDGALDKLTGGGMTAEQRTGMYARVSRKVHARSDVEQLDEKAYEKAIEEAATEILEADRKALGVGGPTADDLKGKAAEADDAGETGTDHRRSGGGMGSGKELPPKVEGVDEMDFGPLDNKKFAASDAELDQQATREAAQMLKDIDAGRPVADE